MSGNFEMALKSTLDYLVVQAKTALLPTFPLLGAAELDDMNATDKVFASSNACLFWQWRRLTPQVGQTLYEATFLIGAKTTADAGSYKLADLLSRLLDRFNVGDLIPLCDYSGTAGPYPQVGTLFLTQKDVDPQQFDKQSGLRYASFAGRVVRWPL